MKKYLKLIIAGLVIIILVTVFSFRSSITKKDSNRFSKVTPTLFFHGYGSSLHAEKHMVNFLKEKGSTNTVIKAYVSPTGHVFISGKLPEKIKNPIVEVDFENSREANYAIDGQWTKNVVVALQKRYGMRKMNMVGHSMGNMDIMYYLLKNSNDNKLPKLCKQVDLAGHFNGILGYTKVDNSPVNTLEKPRKMDSAYSKLLPLRNNYPNKQVRVLNVYGNIGNGSDGTVSNNSSKSLKYLLNGRELSYNEREIKGVSHSKLHENTRVDNLLFRFLYH